MIQVCEIHLLHSLYASSLDKASRPEILLLKFLSIFLASDFKKTN